MSANAQSPLYSGLVELADTLVSGFDVVELADRLAAMSIELAGADEAGIMLSDQRGTLRVLASSTEQMRLLELLEVQNDEGPCLEAFASGRPVLVEHLEGERDRWPIFADEALAQGITAAYALPLRLRETTIGAFNLFCANGRTLDDDELQVAHVLASMATIGIINHRTNREQELLAEQLQSALNSRVIIEQAKGVVSERINADMSTAFAVVRSLARRSNSSITAVAEQIVRDRPTRDQLLGE